MEAIRTVCDLCHKSIIILIERDSERIEIYKNCNCSFKMSKDFLIELSQYFSTEPEVTTVVVTDEVIEFTIPKWLSPSEKTKLRHDLENIYNSLIEFFRSKQQ